MRALYLLLGDPVAHSRSPAIHARAFALLGVDAVYAPCRVLDTELAAAIAGIRALGVSGFNITMPHKQAVVALVDKVDPSFARINAVNCVVREGDALIGHNTDAPGLLRALRAAGVDPAGLKAAVVGAGGAASAAAWALSPLVAKLTVLNRSEGAAQRMAASINKRGGAAEGAPLDSPGPLREADLVVQCTAIGMDDDSDETPFDPALLSPRCALVDLAYRERGRTALLEAAPCEKKIEGLDVLVHQAIASLEIWLQKPQLDHLAPELRKAAA